MDPKEKQKLYVLFGIFGFAAFMFYCNLLLRPQFSGFVAANGEFKAVKARLKSAEVLIANESRIKNQYANISKETRLLEKRLPAQGEISNLLEDFSRVAESSGIKILRIKPLEQVGEASKGGGFYTEFPILVEARGGYHQFGAFINKLEDAGSFINIEEIDVRGRSGDSRRHDIKLRVTTYVVQ